VLLGQVLVALERLFDRVEAPLLQVDFSVCINDFGFQILLALQALTRLLFAERLGLSDLFVKDMFTLL
jgi:hypothetical protein